MKLVVEQLETPADKLRRQIEEAETRVVNLKGAGREAVMLLELLDEIARDYENLSRVGIDLRPEAGRIEGIYSLLRKNKSLLLRELRPFGELAKVREERKPAESQWWWFLDEELKRERKRALTRYVWVGLMALAIVGVAVFLWQKFFKPDPTTVALYQNLNSALNHIRNGQFVEAIPYLERNMALTPAEAEWPIRLGVLTDLLGDAAQSHELFETGRRLSASEEDFLIQRSQYYLEAEAYERALPEAQRATEINPRSPMAFHALARAYAGLGRRQEALAAYEKVLELAEKGNEPIYVMAKIEMAQLLQSAEPSFAPPATAVP